MQVYMHLEGKRKKKKREMQGIFKMLGVFVYRSILYSLKVEFPDHIPRTIHWNWGSSFGLG